ncbi:TonB-dependent receptor domain-containing protein [Henriciella litoralis]|uniref:TonB-dependent receptor domain-containing protein n=1 Tax=Henriciella litoralis TaxID=568102 RepID=UPI000A0609F9|nr:TonB-dependent receptor [Henriciella litoralis]
MTNRLLYTSARSAIVLALATGFASVATAQEDDAPATVQQQADEGDLRQEKVTVTGSFIAGTPEDAALPVDVFSAEDLEVSGVSSPLEFIKSLPSVGSVLGDSNQFAASAQGAQGQGSINLRNLGATRNLVLLNGKRTIASPGDGYANTQLIPLFALERIELLKDGAAATYGSDAISGVANFITKTNFDGIELKGDFKAIDGSDGDYEVSALFGKNFENGNFMFGVGQQHRSELKTTERDFVNRPYSVNPAQWSVLGNPSTYIPKLGPISQGAAGTSLGLVVDGQAINTCEAMGGIVGSTSGLPICRFSYVPFDNLVEDSDRLQVFTSFEAELSPEFRMHGEALYANSETTNNRYSPSFPPTQGPKGPGSTYAFDVPSTNPGYAAFIAQSGLSGGVADPFTPGTLANTFGSYASILLGRPIGLGGNEELYGGTGGQVGIAEDDAFRVSGGFEWDVWEDATWSNDLTFYKSDRVFYTPDIVGQRLQDALEGFGGPNCDRTSGTAGVGDCMFFNPFINAHASNPALGLDNPAYVPGNENSRELLDHLFLPSGTDQSEDYFVYDTVLTGLSGINLSGGEIAYAVGGQFRHSNFATDPINDMSNAAINPCAVEGDNSCLTNGDPIIGPFIFLGQYNEARLQQSVYALFGEVNFPILDNLDATLAVRYEDYGGGVGSTTDPKISLRYEPADWLVLRGSAGTTFRGPLPSNIINGRLATNLAGIQAANNNFKSVDSYGNPDLKPETAFTYNIGAVFDFPHFRGSIDYWSYDFEDEITTTPAQAVANAVGNGPGDGTQLVDCNHPLAYLLTFNGNTCTQGVTTGNDIQRVRVDVVNGPGIKTTGLDLAASTYFDVGPGEMTIGGAGTYTLDYDVREFELGGVTFAEGYDAVGFLNWDRSAPSISEFKANLYANYALKNINLRYQMQYISGVTDNRGPANGSDFGVSADDYVQYDILGAWTLPVNFAEVQLTGAIENITDQDPAAARTELSYNPFVGNALGRTYSIGLTLRY